MADSYLKMSDSGYPTSECSDNIKTSPHHINHADLYKYQGPSEQYHVYNGNVGAGYVQSYPVMDVPGYNPTTSVFPVGYGGWNPARYASQSRQNVKEVEDDRRKLQIQQYVDWVNAQLRKKSGSRPVADLKTDMQNGVAFALIIEIIAGVKLEGIHWSPGSMPEMLQNLEMVLNFMKERSIRMHRTTAQDIVGGNVKSVMRLLLALACHFKPNSVKQSPHSKVTSSHRQTVASIAQGAASALADARREAASAGHGHHPHRPRHMAADDRCTSQHRGVSEGTQGVSPSASAASSLQHRTSPQAQKRLDFTAGDHMVRSRSYDHSAGDGVDAYEGAAGSDTEDASSSQLYETLFGSDNLVQEMAVTKNTLLQLQDLLLSGSPPDGAESTEVAVPIEARNLDEENVILRSKLQHCEIQSADLKVEVSRLRNECMELQGIKSGLQQRLSEQEQSFQAMKAELLRAGFSQQSLESTKADLERQLEGKDRLILEIRRDLAKKGREMDEMKTTYQVEQQQKENISRNLRAQINDLHEKLGRVGETEATLSARVASQDRKMARLEGRMIQTQYEGGGGRDRPSSARSVHSTESDDYQAVKDSLQSLRTRFPGNDPQHHTIDQLEESISSLMDRLSINEPGGGIRRNYDSTGDVRRSPINALHGFPSHRLDTSTTSSSGHNSTKVLYFIDRTVTPFMCSIPKRLGDICLRDIKELVDRPGSYRYHFKAMDPEFGTVKEEITHDEDVIPGWEGKIVAWIEEDQGG